MKESVAVKVKVREVNAESIILCKQPWRYFCNWKHVGDVLIGVSLSFSLLHFTGSLRLNLTELTTIDSATFSTSEQRVTIQPSPAPHNYA